MSSKRAYLPAARFPSLTPHFDRLARLFVRADIVYGGVVERMMLGPGDRVLDLGTGTGSLAHALTQRHPEVHVTGVDPDPDALGLAREKAPGVEFVQASATELPFGDATFDAAMSSLVFHHLGPQTKRAALRELARVLKPGAPFHLADVDAPDGPLQRVASFQLRVFDGFENSADNVHGRLPDLMREAGFGGVERRRRLKTPSGTVGFFVAHAPAA